MGGAGDIRIEERVVVVLDLLRVVLIYLALVMLRVQIYRLLRVLHRVLRRNLFLFHRLLFLRRVLCVGGERRRSCSDDALFLCV